MTSLQNGNSIRKNGFFGKRIGLKIQPNFDLLPSFRKCFDPISENIPENYARRSLYFGYKMLKVAFYSVTFFYYFYTFLKPNKQTFNALF